MNLAWILGLFLVLQQQQDSDQLTITYENEPIMIISQSDLTSPIPGFPLPDMQKLNQLSDQLDSQIRREAVDAEIDDSGRIIPEQAGIELNQKAFMEQLFTYFYQNGPASTLPAPTRTIYPRVDSEILSNIKNKRIGHYVTYFNSRNKERSHNIFLAAEAIDNYVVFPGEVFSFNKIVGKRTKEKGYLSAPIIVKGELSEGIGGGICQVSSTLFNAVDRSGMKIMERYSHSKRVRYVPPGRDATVSWYGPDFTFKNIYNEPILIKAKAIHGMMIVLVFSSDEIQFQPNKIPNTKNKLPPETKINQAG
ncbi:VanW family protein [Bacillus tuaregi]|uniref:VanW family protein n=1 Tax=Bacillus tuaregi TaxID=1816695 RepID=UPI0008F8F6C0|nr:VanW family protein [Bacillus tuaregi]